MPILIREHDVAKLLPVPQALTLVENALRAMGEGRAQNQPRQRIKVADGVLHVMPAGLPAQGYVGFKAYTSFRARTQFYFHLFDARSGEYLAVIQADRLGQIRTGAASGVATKYLARADAQTAGIVGAGWQAESQLEAVCAVRKIRVARCYSRNQERNRAFAEKMSARLRIRVEAVDDVRHAVFDSDVLITATSASKAVVSGAWLMPGTHINAIGANWAGRRELDDKAIQRCHPLFVDSLEQAKIESGDLLAPIQAGILHWSLVQELGDLVAGKVKGRQDPDEITLFKSHGIALEDVAVGGYVYERARAEGLGEALPL